ncbi:MAG: MoaD/ThiS family protein [Verrucomicrobiales bacterium]|nr:MoaD/ThiS family protein [Verrucomicrobiales bacterium]
MPSISFSPNIRSHVDVDTCEVGGDTVREALELVFSTHPRLRSYLFDDNGTLRKHIAMVLNSEPVHDRNQLSDPIQPDDEIFVMQALSGG